MASSIAKILLVDDDLNFLAAMESVLAGPGRMIFKAEFSIKALGYLLEHNFALILLDVRMPEMDGFETLALIRQRERCRYTPIIFMSGVDKLEEDVVKALSMGAIDYLFKPVTPQALLSKVEIFVDLFHLHEQLKQQAVHHGKGTNNELAIPILAIRPGLIILPLTGLIDEQRCHKLEERLLNHISTSEVKVVVIDVTGASILTDIVRRIKIFVSEIRQKGVEIIFTGSNTSISNAKFVTEIELDGINIKEDLKTGIQVAERMLQP